SSSLIGIIAQRLVRLLCPHCKEAYSPDHEERILLNLPEGDQTKIYSAKGCKRCNQSGYIGRTGIYEVMLLDSGLKPMIHDNASEPNMEKYIRQQFPSIRQDGLHRVSLGQTTIEEVIRVTSE